MFKAGWRCFNMELRHKQQHQENFPVVSFFFSKKLKGIIADYYRFARAADDIADDDKLSAKAKLKQLDELEKVFFGTQKTSKKFAFAVKLREEFLKENLSPSLASDLLKAFRQDAEGLEYKTWAQLTDYCKYSAAPVGRFMLAIHDENPSTYLPANSLCAALQIVNHLQDIKYDAKLLKRVYIPIDLQKEFDVSTEDFLKNKETPEVKRLIGHILEKIRGLLKDAEILPQIVNSLRLRFYLYMTLFLTRRLMNKIRKGDVLAKEIKLSGIDWTASLCYAGVKSLFTKRKSLTTKGF